MNKFRKVICLLLVFTMLTQTNIMYAEELDTDINEEETIIDEYTYISTLVATLGITNGKASCYGGAFVRVDNPSAISIVLQRSKDKSSYTAVANANWNEVFYGDGIHSVSGSKTVSKGYYYRLKVVVRIFANTGGSIETITAYSDVRYY